MVGTASAARLGALLSVAGCVLFAVQHGMTATPELVPASVGGAGTAVPTGSATPTRGATTAARWSGAVAWRPITSASERGFHATVADVNPARDTDATWALGDGHVVAPPTSRASPVAAALNRTCPGGGVRIKSRSADDKKLTTAIAKYSKYVGLYCNSTGMLQMHVPFVTFLRIVDKIASLFGIRRNARILDVGAGCGTLLNYLWLRFNTTGTGVDLTHSAVVHARRHAQPQQLFCHAEAGRFLAGLPSDYYDHVVSWSVIHHIRRKLHQCAVATEMVRVVKPGGFVLVGHLRGEHTQAFWTKHKRCVIPNATLRVVTDYRMFGVDAFRRNKYPSVIIRKTPLDERRLASSLGSPDPADVHAGGPSGAGDDTGSVVLDSVPARTAGDSDSAAG